MADIVLEQAFFNHRRECLAQSPGFAESWLTDARRIIAAFGTPPVGVDCPQAAFAQPLTADQVAVVQVTDRWEGSGADSAAGLFFHFLVVDRATYERGLGDPFRLVRQFPAPWQARALPSLSMPLAPPPARTVDDVRRVLKRVKAGALAEGEDPEAPIERTMENSESPALLGGVQVLVDGGKLVFERPAPDLALVEGLWTLLPESTRAKLWPTSFAFSNELGFDVVILPRVPLPFEEGYTLEEHAIGYPEGRYELALQTAAEAGDQHELDRLFQRRSSNETLRLALILLVIFAVASLLIPRDRERPTPPANADDRSQRVAVAASSIIAVADPYTALMMIEHGHQIFKKSD